MSFASTRPRAVNDEVSVRLDKVLHHHDPIGLPADRPHAFIYYLTLTNHGSRPLTLTHRKWVLSFDDGHRDVVEGDRLGGETPHLEPGESYSFSSYHLVSRDALCRGSFHGHDAEGAPLFVRIPPFVLDCAR